jgi:hypothetical protein
MMSETSTSSAVVRGSRRWKPEGNARRRWLVVQAPGLVLVALGACCLAGCGGHGPTSQAGAEQTALALLKNSAISRRILALSYQAEEAPTTCLIEPQAANGSRFELLVAWNPKTVVEVQFPQSVLLASLSDKSTSKDSFSVTTFRDRFGNPRALPPSIIATFARASLNQSSTQCDVLDNGQLQLVGD